MSDRVTVSVDGELVTVAAGATVAVAVAIHSPACRRSVTGQLRAPLCGMGICFECRVSIDGKQHCRSCQIVAQSGMSIRTDV